MVSVTQYRSIAGDTVDRVCWHIYGRTSGAVERVLEANPGLAALGVALPVGTLINLPELPEAQEQEKVQLW